MRMIFILITLLPITVWAQMPFDFDMHGGQPPHHRPPHGMDGKSDHFPDFLNNLDLTSQQQTAVKNLLESKKSDFESKMQEIRKADSEIKQLAFSSNYSPEKVQPILDKVAGLHKELLKQKLEVDRGIYALLTAEQKQKLTTLISGQASDDNVKSLL